MAQKELIYCEECGYASKKEEEFGCPEEGVYCRGKCYGGAEQ